MKRSLVILFLMLSAVVSQVNAGNGDQYWMAKAGVSWLEKTDKPDMLQVLNVTYGYGLSESVALELDYQQSVAGGEYSRTVGGTAEIGAFAYKLGSIGAAYRYVFYERLYFRGKAAFAYGLEERTSSLGGTLSADVTNLTGSLAIGILAGSVMGSSLTLELEYLQQSSVLNSTMLGANLTF